MTRLADVITRSAGILTVPGNPSPRLDSELLTGHALGLARSELYTQSDRRLTEQEERAVAALVDRRLRREPVAYITGHWGFRELDLAVDRRVLIPRPETEELVSMCLALLAGRTSAAVIDVGTGSGAIALSIAWEHPGATVTGVDVSADALEVARANGEALGIAVEWLESDLLGGVEGRAFDLIVSNPPYIAEAELESLEPEVRDWEPRIATSPGADGMADLAALAEAAPAALHPGGWLVVECGLGQAPAVEGALRDQGFVAVESRADFAGIARFVLGRLP